MSVIAVYSRLYADCFSKAVRGIVKNPWTLLLPMAIGIALQVIASLIIGALPGLVAGLVLSLAADALFSSYLYFVGEVVAIQRVTIKEFGRSMGRYFWSVVNLQFVLWIASWVLNLALGGSAQGGLIITGLWLVATIVLNPAPEVIYIRGSYGGLQTVQASWEFIKSNWIEWYVPNLPLLFGLFVVYVASSALSAYAAAIFTGALFHVVMVFRGQLFQALDGSSHRQRMFRYRNQ